MFGQEDHDQIHRPFLRRLGSLASQHVQEIGGVAQPRIGRYGLLAHRVAVIVGDDGWHLGGQVGGLADIRLQTVVTGIRIAGGER